MLPLGCGFTHCLSPLPGFIAFHLNECRSASPAEENRAQIQKSGARTSAQNKPRAYLERGTTYFARRALSTGTTIRRLTVCQLTRPPSFSVLSKCFAAASWLLPMSGLHRAGRGRSVSRARPRPWSALACCRHRACTTCGASALAAPGSGGAVPVLRSGEMPKRSPISRSRLRSSSVCNGDLRSRTCIRAISARGSGVRWFLAFMPMAAIHWLAGQSGPGR